MEGAPESVEDAELRMNLSGSVVNWYINKHQNLNTFFYFIIKKYNNLYN